MHKNYLLAIAAGIVSSLLNLSVLTGGIASIFLSILVALPLFLSGLGLGTRGVMISVLVAAVIIGFVGGLTFAGSFLLLSGIPAIIVSRQALLAKPNANGQLEWYPIAMLVVWLTGLVAVYAGLALIFAAGDEGGVWQQVAILVHTTFEAMSAELPKDSESPFNEATVEFFVRVLPAVLAASWMLGIVVDAALAQTILRRAGKNIRPLADITDFRLPNWLAAIFLGAMAIALWLPGDFSIIGIAVSGVIATAYFFQGLAVVHALARNMKVGKFFLVPFYMLLIIFVGWLTIVVFGLGLVDQAVGFRDRFKGPNSDQEDE